jgi:hypothetical protein
MKTALYGRILLGASAVLFGVLTFVWRDADTWQNAILQVGAIVGGCLAVVQVVGGIGLAFARTARVGSILLGIVYALFSIACIPGIIAKPTVYVQYGGFFEWFSPVCGALAVYAATEANATIGRVARVGIGLCAVSFTLAQIVYFRYTATLVPTWIPPNQAFWAVLTTVAFGLAAIAILVDVKARLALRLMSLMLALFGLLVWVPQLIAHPSAHGDWSEFALNFLITGAAWTVAENRP